MAKLKKKCICKKQPLKLPLTVDNAVLIRTITLYHVGRIVKIADGFVTLADAAWVADTGRFSEALTTGVVSEAEPFPEPVSVAIGAIVDVTHWNGVIPLAR